MIPVEGHKNLFRDESTGAIVNCDNKAYLSYLEDKKRNFIKKEEIDSMKDEIETLKSMLRDLASKITS